jgi:hypothetical protein
MISARFALDHPRLGVKEFLRPLTDPSAAGVEVLVEVEVDGEQVTQHVQMVPQEMPREHGARWWAVCPVCGLRCGHLYITPRLRCRRCTGLQYATQYERP